MALGLCTLSDANVRKVLADPPLIWRVIAPDDPEAYEEARRPRSRIFDVIFGKKKVVAPAPDFELAEGEVVDTDIDKAWHGLHYMLTQTAGAGSEPLNFLVAGGAEAGDIDVGYGPARLFTASEVKALSQALSPIDAEFLKARFNPAEMMRLDVYPGIWDRDPKDDDTLGYCVEYFESMKEFVAQAAARNVGMVLYLS
jgi:hypothetical protein